ncbi:MAG: GAF domain-containing protein [Deltaproteobacteria bacterium]|nr:GAF domain-containing protein [Deltaproteobacteria bacterium]MBW1953345.1 GAF domain-containing protein [Deltaproteobacteria bacterium]
MSNQLAFLTQLIELFTSSVSYSERLDNFVHLLARNLKFDLALFFVLEKEKQRLLLNTSSKGPVSPANLINFPLGKGLVGTTAHTRENQIAYRDEPGILQANSPLEVLQPDFQTLASFVVADDNFLYGVLLLIDKKRRKLDVSALKLIKLACRLLAGTIRQALRHDETKKRIAELSALFEIGKAISSTMELDALLERIVSTCAKIINARGAILRIIDEQTGIPIIASEYGDVSQACPVLVPSEVQAAVVSGELPFVAASFPNSKGQIHSYLGVPLIFKGHLKGVLCVYDKISETQEYQEFDAENRQLLFTMAGMITSSIENALTFQELESLAEKNERMVRVLTVLQEISWALMTTVRMEKLLDIILNALTLESGLGYDRAIVLLVNEAHQTLKAVKGMLRRPVPPSLTLREALMVPVEAQAEGELEKLLPKLQIPLKEDQSILARTVLQKKPFHITQAEQDPRVNQELRRLYDTQEFVTVPLIVKDQVTGVIVVDNQRSKRSIRDEDVQILTMFANQAVLAIENSRLYSTIEANARELSLIRERMLESDRLAALSGLAQGMAHEIRNPLTSIGGFARRISKKVGKDSPLRHDVEVITHEVGRLEKLLREVLDFSGVNLGYYEEHQLNQIIEDALTLIERDLAASNIKIVKDLALMPAVHCDDRQIKQVFYNLFQNARQAMEKGGTLTIRTYPMEKADGLYAAAAVSDTGGGIPIELVHNIFNPFFTTKEFGTGLGLSIAQRIVSRHYGEIEIINELGKGVTFIVTLPITKYCLINPPEAQEPQTK